MVNPKKQHFTCSDQRAHEQVANLRLLGGTPQRCSLQSGQAMA